MFKDLIDAVHDLKRTIETDGVGWVPSKNTIAITQEEWDEALADPYLQTLPQKAQDDLAAGTILGVLIAIKE